MNDQKTFSNALSITANFRINPIDSVGKPTIALAPQLDPNLGPLAAFTGTWTGKGFNTVFRPDSARTPTAFVPPITGSDNVLELNLTDETLSFSKSLGSIPNRGSGNQPDIFLNGVPYLQSINDTTTSPATGIHFEPGIWLAVPATAIPNEPFTVARMASIPHGTTITAQGIALPPINGKPTIAAIDITPFPGGQPNNKIRFPSQTAANNNTPRLPQDLTSFIAAGTITQPLIDDPNTMLRNQITAQTITQTVVIEISTKPGSPLTGGPLPVGVAPNPPPAITPTFGGGTSNIAFLQGLPTPPPSGQGPNADAFQMDAVFWIETVVYDVVVPALPSGSAPIVLDPVQKGHVPLVPNFIAAIPFVPGKGFAGGTIKVTTTQIQYSQKVMLNFFGLTWPHVSVATLVPAAPIPIPANLLPLT